MCGKTRANGGGAGDGGGNDGKIETSTVNRAISVFYNSKEITLSA